MAPKGNLFLITGSTGNTGAPTVKLLRDAGHRVRALVHDIDERSRVWKSWVRINAIDTPALEAANLTAMSYMTRI